MQKTQVMEDHLNQVLLSKLRFRPGMLAALDQSGGSTPAALAHYGISASEVLSKEQMFELVHQMRVRVMTSPNFDGDRVLGVILFERTLREGVQGQSIPEFLMGRHSIASFLKIDQGLDAVSGGAQLMKPIPNLADTLHWARELGVVGTKMRSLIQGASEKTVVEVVRQQFALAEQIYSSGLIPIVETEVSIGLPEQVRSNIEHYLLDTLEAALDTSSDGLRVFLKLTIPASPGFYEGLMLHPKVYRVFALSGGFSRREACDRLAVNPGMIASFSRALLEDLRVGMSESDFDRALDRSIREVIEASTQGGGTPEINQTTQHTKAAQ